MDEQSKASWLIRMQEWSEGRMPVRIQLPEAVVEYLLMLMVCVDKRGMRPLVLRFLSYQRLLKGQYCPGILTFDLNE